jgi:hypothetical protein
MQHSSICEYTLTEAVEDGVLTVVGMAHSKPLVVTRAVAEELSAEEWREHFAAFFRWQEEVEPNLPEEERLCARSASNGARIWVIEDGAAITLLYPGDY